MNKKVIIIAIVILLIIVIGVVAYTMSSSTPAPTPSAAASTAAAAPVVAAATAPDRVAENAKAALANSLARQTAPEVGPMPTPMSAPMSTLSAPAASATVTGGSVPTFTTVYSKGSYGSVDLGATETNRLFGISNVFRRECSDCVGPYTEIYYKRLTPIPSTLSIYSLFNEWKSTNNLINVDFKLYRSMSDLLKDTNAWATCNYDDAGIGFPRDCGPTTSTIAGGQWNSLTRGGQQNVKFSVLNPGITIQVPVSSPVKKIRLSRRTPGIINLAEIQPYDVYNSVIPSIATYGPLSREVEGHPSFGPENAIDRNLNNFAHTLRNESYIELNLNSNTQMTKLVITNRKDCCQDRAIGIKVEFLGEDGSSVAPSIDINENKPTYTFEFRSSGGAPSWLASHINLPQYLRHLQNKNYLLY